MPGRSFSSRPSSQSGSPRRPTAFFSIDITPVFLRLDGAAVAQSRAIALGLDVDIRLGAVRLHFAWSAVSLAALTAERASTKPASRLL